jgi:hypothetical protein
MSKVTAAETLLAAKLTGMEAQMEQVGCRPQSMRARRALAVSFLLKLEL